MPLAQTSICTRGKVNRTAQAKGLIRRGNPNPYLINSGDVMTREAEWPGENKSPRSPHIDGFLSDFVDSSDSPSLSKTARMASDPYVLPYSTIYYPAGIHGPGIQICPYVPLSAINVPLSSTNRKRRNKTKTKKYSGCRL